MTVHVSRAHLRIRDDSPAAKARVLTLTSSSHAAPDVRRRLGRWVAAKLLRSEGRSFDVQIDAIEQRTRDPSAVAANVGGGASTLAAGVREEPTRARVHRRDEKERRGKRKRGLRPTDRDPALLHRLAKHLEHVARELGELVEEEH